MQIEKTSLLVVDDDVEIRQLLARLLCDYNFDVTTAEDGSHLTSILESKKIDLIILDLMLPGTDGLTLCQEIRRNFQTPIIMLTAVGEEADKIVGLEMGADDYVSKPFNPRELVARIKAVLRRTQNITDESLFHLESEKKHCKYEFSGWTFDLQARQLFDPEQIEIEISTGEYLLLLAFIKNPNIVLSREQLLDITQNRSAGPFDRSIDVQVSRLRQKIETNPKKPEYIKTVRAGGYVFTPIVKKTHEYA